MSLLLFFHLSVERSVSVAVELSSGLLATLQSLEICTVVPFLTAMFTAYSLSNDANPPQDQRSCVTVYHTHLHNLA